MQLTSSDHRPRRRDDVEITRREQERRERYLIENIPLTSGSSPDYRPRIIAEEVNEVSEEQEGRSRSVTRHDRRNPDEQEQNDADDQVYVPDISPYACILSY